MATLEELTPIIALELTRSRHGPQHLLLHHSTQQLLLKVCSQHKHQAWSGTQVLTQQQTKRQRTRVALLAQMACKRRALSRIQMCQVCVRAIVPHTEKHAQAWPFFLSL